MGKSGGRMRRSGSSSSSSSMANGGIMGSGIFGMFGTTIRCESTDDSFYCNMMKFINMFIMILLVIFILWTVYTISYPFLFRKSRR
jgi:hypothetical protein